MFGKEAKNKQGDRKYFLISSVITNQEASILNYGEDNDLEKMIALLRLFGVEVKVVNRSLCG